MRPHRRTPLAPICFVGILLAGTTLADDDMHNKNAMPSPIGQQPTSTPSAHATDPKSSASQNTLATPDAMATHMEEMAAMMRQKGQAMEAMGRQMQEGSMQMHQQAMAMKTGDASAHQGMDMSATMQHMQQMNEDMKHCEMQMQRVDATMQKMDSSMGGGMAKKKMGHM